MPHIEFAAVSKSIAQLPHLICGSLPTMAQFSGGLLAAEILYQHHYDEFADRFTATVMNKLLLFVYVVSQNSTEVSF
jgi:hypothetical protein